MPVPEDGEFSARRAPRMSESPSARWALRTTMALRWNGPSQPAASYCGVATRTAWRRSAFMYG